MNANYSDWDNDLPPDPEEVYQDLLRVLQWKTGFGLYFVKCNPVESDGFIAKIPHDLPQKKIAVLRLFEPVDKLYQQVVDCIQDQKIDILLIKGLEYSLYKYEKRNFGEITEGQFINLTKVPPILNHFNQQRERFRDDFSFCFVFLLRSFSLNYLIHRAPDFYDWRSGVYELPTTPELVQQESHRLLLEGDYEKYLQLTPEEKIEKVLEIQELLTEKHQTDDNRASLLFELGNLLYSANEYETAITFYEQELKFKPDDHYAWYNRGNALVNLGDNEKAILSYNQAIEIKPHDPYAWKNKGNALRNLGRNEEAVLSYNKAIEYNPNDYYSWYELGNALRNLGRNEEAVLSYDEAIKIQPNDHYAWNNRGIALRSLRQNEAAVLSYDEALKIQPDDHYAWYNRGIALRSLGRNEEAIFSYDQALKFNPDDYYAWNNRGNALDDLGRTEEALFSYDQALKLKPDDNFGWYNKACCYAIQGNIEESLKNLQQAIKLQPAEVLQRAKTDTDFDFIREDIRFQALMQLEISP
ncbi:tetratricopeptide repeat protein [Sphaerospermopsis aphanizomenoides BCCUSP55]|uniref:tetratricopeptide repeat protein n=1 Tax=Sphaerospermopsis aphanizomenoides TaxID=459663 RepID=UPI0019048E4E|nr:tetratricopeptide repeat protein [Sphaerospermopsis aphanizomenoides]MBK1988702.1 tetratricopeptide repeat protein [Sphaerospermopsis aphanizomenoides BCCUSP55]